MQIPMKVEGIYLDNIGELFATNREEYGNDENNKPNEYCVWQNVSFSTNPRYAWVETDEHYRIRILQEHPWVKTKK